MSEPDPWAEAFANETFSTENRRWWLWLTPEEWSTVWAVGEALCQVGEIDYALGKNERMLEVVGRLAREWDFGFRGLLVTEQGVMPKSAKPICPSNWYSIYLVLKGGVPDLRTHLAVAREILPARSTFDMRLLDHLERRMEEDLAGQELHPELKRAIDEAFSKLEKGAPVH